MALLPGETNRGGGRGKGRGERREGGGGRRGGGGRQEEDQVPASAWPVGNAGA